ncbi:MAG: TRAP transporter fused permease subunit [Rhodoplanes sp.]
MTNIIRRSLDPKFLLGAAFFAFQYWILWKPQQPLFERPIHLVFALSLLFLASPLTGKTGTLRWLAHLVDAVLLLAVAGVAAYYLHEFERLSTRMENVSPVEPVDIVAGVVLVLLLLEGVRREVGWILLGLILAFLAYMAAGPYLPGWLAFRGFKLDDAIEILTMTTNGVLGITTQTSVEFVFYFIVFGAVYSAVGGGELFIDLAMKLAGRTTGAAPKTAILSSSLMGSISGSAVANVTATGVFTIPLMRRCGYSPERAGAVEAIASTGGQLMPPIMGVGAFVMAEMLNVPYARVALAGLIPALAFYLALLAIVDLNARREGVGSLSAPELAELPPVLPRLHLLLPPVVLIGALVYGYSAQYAAVIATFSCLIAAYLRPSTWLSPAQLLDAIRDGAIQAAQVAVPIAAIGIIIAVAVQSNLALKFASSLVSAGGGTLVGSLILIILGCIIMGMGLPTVAAYIIGAVLYVPAMKHVGISELSANFFVFYYCVLSMVTPPVALASFAAAGISGGSAMKTSLAAFWLCLVAFFVPFSFIFDEAILFNGTAAQIAFASASLLASTGVWAVALGGYWCRPLATWERVMIGVVGVIAVLAPSGTIVWIVAMVTAVAALVVIRMRTASGNLQTQPSEPAKG